MCHILFYQSTDRTALTTDRTNWLTNTNPDCLSGIDGIRIILDQTPNILLPFSTLPFGSSMHARQSHFKD
jgi:hypothetical protein